MRLGDIEMQDCSAEFGNPSGHSLNAMGMLLPMLWYYTDLYKPFFDKNKALLCLANALSSLVIASIVYSRVYTGRHSFDQCLNGLMLGYWNCHFFYYYWRPHVFN